MGACINSKNADNNISSKEEKLKLEVRLSQMTFRSFLIDSSDLSLYASLCGEQLYFKDCRAVSRGVSWSETHSLQVLVSQGSIQKEKLKLTLRLGLKKVGSVKIPLVSMIEGPVSQSFPVLRRGSQQGRLGLSAVILENTDISLALLDLKCFFYKQSNASWSMSFQVSSVQESPSSEISENPRWVYAEDGICSFQAPEVVFRGNIHSIRDTSIKIIVRKHHGSHKKKAGVCWLSFPKLFHDDFHSLFRQSTADLKLPSDNKHFHDKIWVQGKNIGVAVGCFSIKGLPNVQQTVSGVNTEDGILLQTPRYIGKQKTLGNPLPTEIRQISTSLKIMAKSKEVFEKREILKNIITLLKTRHHDSKNVFFYSKRSDVNKAQKVLLKLSEFLLNSEEFMACNMKALYCQCLFDLFKRDELGLGSFDMQYKNTAVRFRENWDRVLGLSLQKIVNKGLSISISNLAYFAIAASWFRVPELREKLIEIFKEKSYQDIPEFVGTYTVLEDHDACSSSLDWENNFHKLLPERQWDLSSIPHDKLASRGQIYFRFISHWISHVKESLNPPIVWGNLPGYSEILKTFILEMKERDILEFPDFLIEAASKLLENEDLLNSFIKIIFTKANVYEYETVVECFRVIGIWFGYMYANNKKFYEVLDWKFLLEGLEIAICSDLSANICAALDFVYMNLHCIRKEFRYKLIGKVILKKWFEHLNWHWSYQVRHCFHALILYKLFSLRFLCFEDLDEWRTNDFKFIERAKKVMKREACCVYSQRSKQEFKQARESYHVWKKQLPEKNLVASGPYLYGHFKEFPYPDPAHDVLTDRNEDLINII